MKVRWFSLLVASVIAAVYLKEIGTERALLSDSISTFKSSFSEVAIPIYATLETILNDTWITAPGDEGLLNRSNVSKVAVASRPTIRHANAAATSPLYDQTIPWNATMPRPWLDSSSKKPPAMMMLTNFGWNHPNQTVGIQLFRGLRTLELVEGIVNHEYFHPTAWEDLNDGTMEISNEIRYYIFLDHEHCGTAGVALKLFLSFSGGSNIVETFTQSFLSSHLHSISIGEMNYPRYGHGNMVNRDKAHNRSTQGDLRQLFWRQVRRSKLVQDAKHVKYVLFDCGGWGPTPNYMMVRNSWKEKNKLAFLSLSTTRAKVEPWDQGLVPPACRKFHLTSKEEDDIKRCNEASRPVLLSFTGQISRSQTRRDLLALNNNENVVVGGHGSLYAKMNTTDAGIAFERLAKQSAFAAAPRGDNLFSYRFSEVMACGAIPVVYADDWLLPFGPELINWTEAAVFIRENDTKLSVEILSNISLEERCRMRQKVLEIYRRYIETGAGTIRGIMEAFQLRAQLDT